MTDEDSRAGNRRLLTCPGCESGEAFASNVAEYLYRHGDEWNGYGKPEQFEMQEASA